VEDLGVNALDAVGEFEERAGGILVHAGLRGADVFKVVPGVVAPGGFQGLVAENAAVLSHGGDADDGRADEVRDVVEVVGGLWRDRGRCGAMAGTGTAGEWTRCGTWLRSWVGLCRRRPWVTRWSRYHESNLTLP